MSIAEQTLRVFSEKYGSSPLLFRAPGRINILGEHVDYNHGFCLPAAIEQAIYFAINNSDEEESTLYSVDQDTTFRTDAEINPSWSKYIASILELMDEKELRFQPFYGVIQSDLPIGAGLSSSAALCCGFIYALDRLNEWNLPRQEIALLAQAAEHRVGIKCGLMDQFGVLFGKKDHVVVMDCVNLTHNIQPMNLQSGRLALINSHVAHDLAQSAYNDRRANCHDALNRIGERFPEVASFRDLSPARLEAANAVLKDAQIDYVGFVISEIARVHQVVDLLSSAAVFADEELTALGNFLFSTHNGLKNEYRVTCEETDLLVDLGRRTPGIYGARQVGGGFGGCVLFLCNDEGLDRLSTLMTDYEHETSIRPSLLEVALSDGIEANAAR